MAPTRGEEDTQSEASEWELRERREREEESSQEAEKLGAEEEPPLFRPVPSFMASAAEEQGTRGCFFRLSFVTSFVISFVISLVRSATSWDRLGRGKGEPHRETAD